MLDVQKNIWNTFFMQYLHMFETWEPHDRDAGWVWQKIQSRKLSKEKQNIDIRLNT